MNSPKTFIVLDGNALLHRAWHAIPPLTTRDGRVVNAAYGFTNVIEKMLSVYKPDYMAVAWDLPGATFRHEAFEEYKAQREKKADELYEQIPIIQNILLAYGIPSYSAPGYEADDILGTIARLNELESDVETLIVTGDRDALQLVSDTTKVLFFVKGLSEVKLFDAAAVEEKYGLTPQEFLEVKALMGDSSDNLPGVPGIGEKGACDLIKQFGTVERILTALSLHEVPEKYAKKFLGNEDQARKMRMLVEISRNVPLPDFSRAQCAVRDRDGEKLRELFTDLEFTSLLKKYQSLPVTTVQHDALSQEEVSSSSLVRVTTPGGVIGDWIGLFVSYQQPDIFGSVFASLSLSDGKRIWRADFPDAAVLDACIRELFSMKRIVVHEGKKIMHAFSRMGFDISPVFRSREIYDLEVISYMLNSSARDFPLEQIILDTTGKSFQHQDDLVRVLPQVAQILSQKLQDVGMEDLYRRVEMPLLPILFSMEARGILVDREILTDLSRIFGEKIASLTKTIYEYAGREFNINSPSQLAEVLFEDLALSTHGIKKTKTGYSTAASELEKLWDLHPIISLIEEYREIAKLKSTYADTLPDLIAADGRIHSQFNQTIAATGRLSSSQPNLQNIPIRTDLGRQIRHAFIAQEDYVLLSADYSQIELRIAAELAHDESFQRAFREGADIHTRTAAEVWNIDEADVTKEQRSAAKAINFSILYGVGPRALARSTGMTFDDARKFIARYFEVHPGIQKYISDMKNQARSLGYVQTHFGRRRYLPDITSGIPQLIASAERMAMNMPIQGTSADLIKLAMISLATSFEGSSLRVQLLLQVHDELIFEVHQDDVSRVEALVREKMVEVAPFSVPLVVDVAVGKSWGDLL